jgi:hypothetical protein
VIGFTLFSLYPGDRVPGTHWMEGWVGPRTGLNEVERRKFLTLREIELSDLDFQSIASCYTDRAIPAD